MVDENNNSCFKRSSTVKWLRACSAVRLLVLDNSPVLLGDTEKNLEKPLPPTLHRKLRPFGTPSSPLNFRCLPCVCVCVCVCVWGGGGGGGGGGWGGGGGGGGGGGAVWIFSGTTQFNPLYTDTFCGPLSIHINAVWPHSSQIVSLKNTSITIPLKHHCWNPRQVEYRHLRRKHLHPLLVIHQYIEPENMKFKLHASVYQVNFWWQEANQKIRAD